MAAVRSFSKNQKLGENSHGQTKGIQLKASKQGYSKTEQKNPENRILVLIHIQNDIFLVKKGEYEHE